MVYLLGAALLVLAYRIFQGVDENVDPDKNLMVRLVRRFYPVTDDFREGHWFVEEDGRRYATPLFLCLVAIVFADIAFAIDSIPAAFAITRDPFLIWMGNVFALLGLRALFVLVEGLIARFRYLDETIAVVLAVVGRQAADRGPGEDRARGEPGDHRRPVRRWASSRRWWPTARPAIGGEAQGARQAHRARGGKRRGGRARRARADGKASSAERLDALTAAPTSISPPVEDVGAQPAAVHQRAQHARGGQALQVRAGLAQPPPGALDRAHA